MLNTRNPYRILLAVLLLLQGCHTIHQVNIDSISGNGAKEKNKYILLPGNKGCQISDLQFIEFKNYTDRILAQTGFTLVQNAYEADVIIFLDYGITGPYIHNYTYSLPVYGQTGVASSHTYGTASTYGNMTNTSSYTSYTPSYGVVGSSTHADTIVQFMPYMTLCGYDLEKYKANGNFVSLWRTEVNCVIDFNDLRRIFPVMITASKNYIATNTYGKITIPIQED